MNSTWLLSVLNTTEPKNNGSTTEEIAYEYEMFVEDVLIEGKGYQAVVLIIAILGVVGNVMSFLITMDAKINARAYSIYLKWLSVSDSVLLIMVSAENILEEYRSLQYMMNYHTASCKLWVFLLNMASILSPWLVVALTLDRFVCVVFPLSRHVLCTWSKAIKICAALTVVSAVLETPLLIFVTPEASERCSAFNIKEVSTHYFMFLILVLTSTAPCLLVLTLNIVTISRIRRSQLFRTQFTQGDANSAKKEVADKSTLPLLIVSIFAFVTLIPQTAADIALYVLDLVRGNNAQFEIVFNVWKVFNIIYLLNFAQNFYILLASWPEYRSIIKQKLCGRETKTKSPQTDSSQISTPQFSEAKVSNMPLTVAMTPPETDLGPAAVPVVE